jgi:hypothetical protein
MQATLRYASHSAIRIELLAVGWFWFALVGLVGVGWCRLVLVGVGW